jgi:hypothetical protein
MSPHADDTAAVARFYGWLKESLPEKFEMLQSVNSERFNKEWCYREMYLSLGGEIKTHGKDGKKLPMKDWKPKNHARKVKELESVND